MFHTDIYTDIYTDTPAIFYDIVSVQMLYRFCLWRSMLVSDTQESVAQFNVISVYENLEELLKRKLRLLDIQLGVLIVSPHKRISEIP